MNAIWQCSNRLTLPKEAREYSPLDANKKFYAQRHLLGSLLLSEKGKQGRMWFIKGQCMGCIVVSLVGGVYKKLVTELVNEVHPFFKIC